MSRPPIPRLSQFILKVHSRCDLACDHCYVYEGPDQSWHGRPMAIPDEVITQSARRIAEYARANRLGTVQIVLHGGEPLLAGRPRLHRIATELRSALGGVCRLDLMIHTNGIILDEKFCELFDEHDIKVGISIDGDRAANDRHRRYADGRSSYDKVLRAVELLRTARFRHLYAGLLCTVDVANDPVLVYQALMQLEPPQIDFLLPHATWDHPPARRLGADTEYADWFIAVYQQWQADGRPAQIRTFDSMLSTLGGGTSFTEALGLGPAGVLVIETDGSYEQVDSLKVAFEGAPETGTDVFAHPVDAVARHPGIVARQQGKAGLCQTCQECPVVTSCGGGLYTHRYRATNGFSNPSVYCADLFKLISHISEELPASTAGGPHTPAHVLSDQNFRSLAAGFGDGSAMAQLAETQHSLVRGLLGAVYQQAISAPVVPVTVQADLHRSWSLLTALDREHPEALAAALRHPYLRVWAVRCLDRLAAAAAGVDADAEPADGSVLAADLRHLGAIAATAAIRAGTGGSATAPVLNAAVHLPALGRLVLGPDQGAWPDEGEPGTATIDVISKAVIVRVGDDCWNLDLAGLLAGAAHVIRSAENARLADWQPVRLLDAPGISVALDDIDPYRDCHDWPVASRLTDAEFAQWARMFADAWRMIRRDHAVYAPALAAGLSALMPLAPAQQGRAVSAAARQAFGSVAAALPSDPVTLALLLIHEFQHVKLGAILDVCDLYDPADGRFFHPPWQDDHLVHAPRREDKNQLGSLLQGAYAHLAVTDFWRARQQAVAGPLAEVAAERYALCRAHTREAIKMLANSGSLTPLGTGFVAEMRHSASPQQDPVS
jgi:uncharacterized protein